MFVIAEVKTGRCRLNGPWSRREEENVTNVLRSSGQMSIALLDTIARALYDSGRFQADGLDARLVCFGSDHSQELAAGILQFTWDEVFGFVFDRYQTFWRAKRQNHQWPSVGRFLWDRSKHQERETYVHAMLKEFGIGGRAATDCHGNV